MTGVVDSTASLDPYVDGLLCGTQWDTTNLTYSFPTSSIYYGSNYGYGEPNSNFEPLNAKQQAAVAAALKMYSTVSDLTFTLETESSTQSADIRFGNSSVPPTSWAYYPEESANGGDVWFGDSGSFNSSPIKGNYAFYVAFHELGHALGLKHPHEAMAFGLMPVDHDALEYTVMSYRSYEGADPTKPLTVETYGYPQSLMMYDIAAIQHMYGARYDITNDTTYSWSATTGEEFINGVGQGAPGADRILMTVWAGHTSGTITYDFSNYSSNLNVSLEPGAWTTTSAVQLSNLGNGHVADGNIANALLFDGDTRSLVENAKGGSGADTIVGNAIANTLYGNAGDDKIYGEDGNDVIVGGPGNDFIDGGNGTDTAVYSGRESLYHWSENSDGTWTVSGADGTDTLHGIEELRFSDQTVTIQAPEVVVSSGTSGNSAVIATIDADFSLILRGMPTSDQANLDADLLASSLTPDALIAQLVTQAGNSTIPALVVYDFVLGTTPNSAHLDELASFVSSQVFSPNYQATNDPTLGGYEAMGLGLSSVSEFTSKYAQGSDTSFITEAYLAAFGNNPGQAQLNHFQAQINYFENIYEQVGIDSNDAAMRARGAVLGQIVGVAAEGGGTLEHAAENFLVGLVGGSSSYGVSLLGTPGGSANLSEPA